jgi:predicted DCC family thiol-disulfide oxidoreductase YuxK
LYFDGVCNLCNRLVRFVLKHDRRKELMFASLQSAAGARAQQAAAGQGLTGDSVLLFHKGKYHIRSSAALYLLMQLGGPWKLCAIGFLIPRFIRDRVYDWIARNRYAWFGQADQCEIPGPDIRARFLED